MKHRRRSQPDASYRTHTKQNGDAYLLSGLVFCAHCGCKMHGSTLLAKGHRYPKYICSTYARSGKHNPHGCGHHGMPQDDLVEVLVRKLQETVLSSDGLDRLREALRRKAAETRTAGSSGAGDPRKQLAELDREIDRAAENFLRAPAEVLDLIGKKLTALKRQRQHVQEELRAAEAAAKPRDVEAEVEACVGRLWRLRGDLAAGDPARRREVFRAFVDRIELRFDQVPQGKRISSAQSNRAKSTCGQARGRSSVL
jgi:site-specific DNA recombinase